MKKQYGIVVAGGKGSRMGSDIPKQFLPLGGQSIIGRTLEALRAGGWDAETTRVVLPQSERMRWDDLCAKEPELREYVVVTGGATRTESVWNGLESLPEVQRGEAIVGVHDGVRPFVSRDLLVRIAERVDVGVGAVPLVGLKDSVRQLTAEGSVSLVRETLRAVQTPQAFDLYELKEAYAKAMAAGDVAFTDDASVYEWAGGTIAGVEGEDENIKITTPTDYAAARYKTELCKK